ncbi:diaminopimelate epimerase [Algoriphagus namhaensis]|uniref:Diaminopimelate epimerase n=1 Tax=Algoriphagus namhaensis TaxID=915353 RepID=A0ABV8AQR6_9BACT
MNISFFKYQGTGNDFVMIDDRENSFDHQDLELISRLCDRKFGIGADGVILIRNHTDYDFEMVYFNADGSQSMCGNGARCAVAFAKFLGIVEQETRFLAIDGPHEAKIDQSLVELRMGNVPDTERVEEDLFIDTGSPHHLRKVNEVKTYPIVMEGKKVRHSERYPLGTNVNFVELLGENELFVRTFERGVEDETLSCGTGVTAAALGFGTKNQNQTVKINTLGGNLAVRYAWDAERGFEDIWLIGPAEQVFAGNIEI